MRDLNFCYVPATAGEKTVKLNSGKLWSDYHHLYNYKWDVQIVNNRFGNPRRVSGNSTIQLFIYGDNEGDAYKERDAVFKAFERDVINKTPGRLYIGDCYLVCYISGIAENDANVDRTTIISTLNVDAAEWVWHKDSETSIIPSSDEDHSSIGYHYNYGYPYAYGYSRLGYINIVNTAIGESDFKMVVHGPAVNPVVTIADSQYGANVTLESGDQLIIDSTSKTVKIYRENGDIVNAFADRLTNTFKLLPSGNLRVISNSGAAVDLTIAEKRSEPTWS